MLKAVGGLCCKSEHVGASATVRRSTNTAIVPILLPPSVRCAAHDFFQNVDFFLLSVEFGRAWDLRPAWTSSNKNIYTSSVRSLPHYHIRYSSRQNSITTA